jgi:multiple sugar transport system substrate-binding protein
MKRLFALLTLLGAGAIAFASGTQEPAGTAAQPVKIVYWQYFYESKVQAIDQLIQKFEAQNPGIKVEQVTFPYENYNQKVASSLPAGTGPDVINLFYGWLPSYVKSGYLQPLSASDFSPESFKSGFFPFVAESVQFDGKYYAVPTAVRTLALLYNKKLFRDGGVDPSRPPQDLDELAATARKLSRSDAQGNLVQAGLAMQPSGQGHNWLRDVLIRQFGGTPYSPDGRKVTYDTPEGVAALTWYTDRITKDKVGYPNFATDDVTAFKSQKAAMNIDGSFRIATLNAVKDLEWDVAELPSYHGIRSNYASFWAHGITDGVKGAKLAASVKFLKFITSPDAMDLWLAKVGELPANPGFAAKQKDTPLVGVFLKGLDYAHGTTFVDEAGQRTIFVDMVDQVVLKHTAPADALKEAAVKEQKLIDDFWSK